VKIDAGGTIWAGTNNGLNVYLPKIRKFLPINASDYSTSNIITSIESVTPGEIWASTKKGMMQLTYTWNKNEEKPDYDINYYFSTNGLISSGYIERSSTVSEDKTLFFAGNEGIDFFNPSNFLKQNIATPKTLITEISVDGKKTLPTTNRDGQFFFNLNYNQHMVTFRFTSLNYSNPGQQKFRYKLENFNDRWNYTQNEYVATFMNLKKGQYTFVVESLLNNGKWSGEKDSISFIVTPAFWKTLPFIITLAVLLFLLLYLMHRIRISSIEKNRILLEKTVRERTQELVVKNKELEEANKTKAKFFSIISHDLRSPFSGLLGILELLNTPGMIRPDKKDELISAVYTSAQNTYNLLENLLIWSRSQTEKIDCKPLSVNLSKVLDGNIDLLKEMARKKNIEINKLFPKKLSVKADRNMIDTVIRNLLNNALKFTYPGGIVNVHAIENEHEVVVSIADSGIGIKDTQLENLFTTKMDRKNGTSGEAGTGLGLLICKEFITLNGGKIWATQNHPAGLVFHFTVAKNRTAI
jgi:signal transduction histidine kinase